MTTSSYITAWIIYLLAACGISVIAWNISHNWQTALKYLSRASLVVLLFTPYYSDPEQNRLAPAILVTMFELIFGDPQIGLKSGTPLVTLLLISATAVIVYTYARTRQK